MDNHELFELALALINLVLAGLGVVLWQNLRDVREDAKKSADTIIAHELYCARTYVTQEGLTKAIQNLENTVEGLVQAIKSNMEQNRTDFRDLYNKMNTKQDKS
jgi:uncharacterized protein YoxC